MPLSKKSGYIVAAVILLAVATGIVWLAGRHENAGDLRKLSLRLQWTPQAQFAGFIVARDLGYYREVGLEVEIRPAGPDLKPHTTVAAGSDDFGVGVSNQIILARSNGVPLTIVSQIFQDSANRYVLRSSNRVHSLTDLRGEKVGLWLGGDEAEFVAMLASAGMSLTDVQVVPQEFSTAPFLQGAYRLSQVPSVPTCVRHQKLS